MRRRKLSAEHLNQEFELDLAPLLAVMVKLVPVLIGTSVFVPIVIIQSELPAPVAAAVSEQTSDPTPQLELFVNPQEGLNLKLSLDGQTLDQAQLPYPTDWKDLASLKEQLFRLKKQAPQLFKLELLPQGNVPYEAVIKIIDASRKSPFTGERFQFKDPQTGNLEETDYMFPEVVFANILEG